MSLIECRQPVDVLTMWRVQYCQTMQRGYGKFTEEVEDVIPLSNAARSLAQQGLMDHIVEEQRKDKDIFQMMDWLQGDEPDKGILALASPPLKHIWVNRQLLSIIEDAHCRADWRTGIYSCWYPNTFKRKS
ncbi:hypothetical protein PoB_004713400 [Plakobranchus ocellatus]|uniref:Uncharacterized protein n=1 Tax=Plakobranchus ocellatus TaxID=259542 RepID=A0AAV4BKF2_9GAST|nr:hypothetical protein PoB_004713400 [Plakobranchus ocellatus]